MLFRSPAKGKSIKTTRAKHAKLLFFIEKYMQNCDVVVTVLASTSYFNNLNISRFGFVSSQATALSVCIDFALFSSNKISLQLTTFERKSQNSAQTNVY